MQAGGCSPGAALLGEEVAALAASAMLPVSSFQPFFGWRLISGTSPITFQIAGFLISKMGAISCLKNCCQSALGRTAAQGGHQASVPAKGTGAANCRDAHAGDICLSLQGRRGARPSLGWVCGVTMSCPAATCLSRSVELALTAGFSLIFPGLLSCRYSSELCCQLEKFRSQAKKPKQPKSCSMLLGCVGLGLDPSAFFFLMKVTLDAEQSS